MGKRRRSQAFSADTADESLDVDIDIESVEDGSEDASPRKKHKKGKHKKHKKSGVDRHGLKREHKKKKKEKRRSHEYDSGGLKLKIKLGGEMMSTTNVKKSSVSHELDGEESFAEFGEDIAYSDESVAVEPVLAQDDDEEREWLDALEAGDLDDYGQLKSRDRQKPLTARQRALLSQDSDLLQGELLELPMGRKSKEVTEEVLARRSEMARKRRLKQQKQQEEIKKQTVQKLITKQSRRKDEDKEKENGRRQLGPCVRYHQTATAVTLSYPNGIDFPFQAKTAIAPPVRLECSAPGCSALKRYSCSGNGKPVCSLACYKVMSTVAVS